MRRSAVVLMSFSILCTTRQPLWMAKQEPHADADNGLDADPDGDLSAADVANHVTTAIMQLLPAVNDAVAAHRAEGCPACAIDGCGACSTLGLIAAVLDLIIWCWRRSKSEQGGPDRRANRDLRAAVLSRWLTSAESAALVEVLEVLDLAATQADDADMNLPTLAGIGVAVVDGYRGVTLRTITTGEVGPR